MHLVAELRITIFIMRSFILSAFFVITTLTSCFSSFPNRYERPYVYNGFRANKNTMLGSKLNINGYYSLVNDSDNGYDPFILYEDGTYGNILFKAAGKDDYANKHYKKADLELDKESLPLTDKWMITSGYYNVKEDTIFVTTSEFYLLRTELILQKYKIIDRNHLLLIEETYISGNKDENDTFGRNTLFEFIPAKSLPSSSLFPIKHKKWAWADKKDWKKFKNDFKQQEQIRNNTKL